MTDRVHIFTDGACKGNPGPGGWGVVLRFRENEKHLYGGELDTTNNRMELLAVIEALRMLKRPCQVAITTDSQYVKQGMTAWILGWKRNGWRTSNKQPVKNQDLWQALDGLTQEHDVQWHWVKGHSGHPENELADQLANQGIRELKRGEWA
jgi:ribonuclease HI